MENTRLGNLTKKLMKLRKDRKGSLAIEIVIGCFIFLLVLCFLMDVLNLSWRFLVISQTNSYIARTVGLQGGILSSAPPGFPGGNSAYISRGEMMETVERNFGEAGIEADEFKVTINGKNLSSGVSVDYRNQIDTEIVVDYEWTYISNFIPGNLSNEITSKRSVVSEFKYRYDEWVGE